MVPAYDDPMELTSTFVLATETCQQTTAAGTAVGVVILLAIVAAIVILSIITARSRRQLATANAELAYLRPENARLQEWLRSASGPPIGATAAGVGPSPQAGPAGDPYPIDQPIPAAWYTDPSGRHQFRMWDGNQWTDDVADNGVTSKDAGG
jgi:type II secretory pathway pseudopilin PulG